MPRPQLFPNCANTVCKRLLLQHEQTFCTLCQSRFLRTLTLEQVLELQKETERKAAAAA